MVEVPHFLKNCLQDLTLTWQFGTSITTVFLRAWSLLLHFLYISGSYRTSLIFPLPYILSFRWEACSAFPVSLKMFSVTLTLPSLSCTHWVYPENQTALLRFAAYTSSPLTCTLSFCLVTSTLIYFWIARLPGYQWSRSSELSRSEREAWWLLTTAEGRHEGEELRLRLEPIPGRSITFIITAPWQHD